MDNVWVVHRIHAMFVHWILDCHTGITKPTTQSARRITAQYDMKIMYKYVVNKLAPYWVTVADMLEYSVADRNCFRRDDNRSSLVAMLENWIITDNGREPKTWPTFMKVLKEVDEDQSISVGHDICVKLEKDGVLSSNSKLLFMVQYRFKVNLYSLLRNTSMIVLALTSVIASYTYCLHKSRLVS